MINRTIQISFGKRSCMDTWLINCLRLGSLVIDALRVAHSSLIITGLEDFHLFNVWILENIFFMWVHTLAKLIIDTSGTHVWTLRLIHSIGRHEVRTIWSVHILLLLLVAKPLRGLRSKSLCKLWSNLWRWMVLICLICHKGIFFLMVVCAVCTSNNLLILFFQPHQFNWFLRSCALIVMVI